MTKRRKKAPPKQPKKPPKPRSKTGSRAKPKALGRGRAAAPRIKGTLTRSQAYRLLRGLGVSFANDTTLAVDIPDFVFVRAQRLNFLDRALDNDTQTLASNSLFGGRYRSTWDAQDELFSTASSRNFIDGLLNGLSRDQVSDDVWQRWRRMVDLVSALRIPTRYSGFSTATEVMQHPTAAGTGYFSALEVAGEHGRYDSQRVQYIGRAIQAAQHLDAIGQLRAAMRAAIEFSLNYFTAPVTASNVKPYSTRSGVDSGDESMQAQLESRERIKEIYVQLGGNLRDLPQLNNQPTVETPEQSWDRPWQQGLTITRENPFPEAPPSPRRSRRQQQTSDPLVVPVTVAIGSNSPPQISLNPLGTPTTTTTGPSTSIVLANPLSSSTPISGFTRPVLMFPVLAPPLPISPFEQSQSIDSFKKSSPFAKSSPFDQALAAGSSYLATTLTEDVLMGMAQVVDMMTGWAQPQASDLPESEALRGDGEPAIYGKLQHDRSPEDLDEFRDDDEDWLNASTEEEEEQFEPMLESELSSVSDLEPWEEDLLQEEWDPSDLYDDMYEDPYENLYEDLYEYPDDDLYDELFGTEDALLMENGPMAQGMELSFPAVPTTPLGGAEGVGGAEGLEAAGGESGGVELLAAVLA